MLHRTHAIFFTPFNVNFFTLEFSSYNCALWLHCRHRRDVSSGCDQRCPNWKRRRLRLALQLLTGTTISAQNAENGLKRQVSDTICQFAVCIWCLVGLCEFYSVSEWCYLRTMVIPVVNLLALSLAFHHEIYCMYAQFSFFLSVLCLLPMLLSPFCSLCSLRGCLWWRIRIVPIDSIFHLWDKCSSYLFLWFALCFLHFEATSSIRDRSKHYQLDSISIPAYCNTMLSVQFPTDSNTMS